jgi:hypothetical protein
MTWILYDYAGVCLIDFAGDSQVVDFGPMVAPQEDLTLAALAFHLCSHGSRDARRGAELGLEGAYALRQRLSREHQVIAEVRLPQAAGPRDAGCHARPELSSGETGGEADVPCVRESEGDGGL